jgi:putative tricarboxylic transport membrane protein
VKVLAVPRPWLYAGILVFGLLGFGLRLFGYPIAPVVVGLILGPLSEQQLRRALSISQGDPSILVHSWLAIALYAVAAAALFGPLLWRLTHPGSAGIPRSEED